MADAANATTPAPAPAPALATARADASGAQLVNSTQTALVVRIQQHESSIWTRWRAAFFAAGIAVVFAHLGSLWSGEPPTDPTNYIERTRRILKTTP